MKITGFDLERGIARCRVFLSLIALLALYVDPTEPVLTHWLPLTGGAFTVNRYWATVLIAHLVYSVTLYWLVSRRMPSARITTIATTGDVVFALAIAMVTEGATSPFYAFFTFAVLAAGLRAGLQAATVVTAVSVLLYMVLIVSSAPGGESYYIVMRAAYIAITGYLVGYLGQERLNQEKTIRHLEAYAQREQIARSLHDGYAQALAGVNLRLETCRELLRRGRTDEALSELTELQTGVNREYDDLREYIRSLVELDGGQGPITPRDHATELSVHARFSSTATRVEHVLLILLEATRNIRRHAGARSAAIGVQTGPRRLLVTIDDDGVGFPEGAPLPWSIVSRAAECGGTVNLGSDGRPGAHLVIELPAVH
jgi:two-component system sensor histidine kinase DesK